MGFGASVGLGQPSAHALAPIAVGLIAALFIRRTWIGAPALAVGSFAALVTAAVLRVSASPAAPPLAEARSRMAVVPRLPHAAASVWDAAWPTALAAVLALIVAQLVITRRHRIRSLGRALTAAAARRLIARSSA